MKSNHTPKLLILGIFVAGLGILFYATSGFNTVAEHDFNLPSLKVVNAQTDGDVACTLRVSLFTQTNDGRIFEVSEDTKSLVPLNLVDPETNEELTNLHMKIQNKCLADKGTMVNLDSHEIGMNVYVDNRQCFIGNWCYTFIERIFLYEEPAEHKEINKRVNDKFVSIKESKSFDIPEFASELSTRFFTDDAEIVFAPYGSITYNVDGQQKIFNISPNDSKVSWVVSVE